jgi:pimeloyl-ACP methyl ester carboxylesterase
VFEQLGGGAADLTVEEVSVHLTDGYKAVFPAEAVLGALQATLAEHGPAQLVGYSYPPRTDQALAIGQTASGERLVVGLGVAAGLIELLDVMGAPPTLVPRGPYNGWYDVGGRRLFLRCTGRGSPTVVFDNGLTTDWYPLQQRLSGLTRVCSYDPARQNGAFGRSDPAPAPRTAVDRVRDLHALLAAARVPGPYVLAGHSNGGLFDLLYASRHPRQVAGLVLIDGVHPGYHRRDIEVIKRFFPPEVWPQIEAAACAIPALQLDYEQVDICTAEAQTAAALAARPLRPMPLSVLSHHPEQFPPGSLEEAREELWTQLQVELAALLPGSHHVIAPTSDHDIHLVHPQLFLDEVTAVVRAVRTGRTTLTG